MGDTIYSIADFEKKITSRQFIEMSFKAFDASSSSQDGISALRLRKGRFHKKLIEEILPISAFLGCFERPGLELCCQYYSGNQGFDAKIYCDGKWVERGGLHEEYCLEVSVACNKQDYLRRECIDKGQVCFGGGAIRRLADGSIESTPRAYSPDDLVKEHLDYVQTRLVDKTSKNYSAKTFLIIPLVPTTLIMPSEWISILEKLQLASLPFCGLFVYDTVSQRKASF